MKRLTLILFLISFGMYAQEGKREKIEAFKTAYLTQKLELTPAEAEKFWPVYNKYDNKRWELHKREREEIYAKLREGVENLSDSEANALIDKSLSLDSEEVELRRQMTAELRKVLSPKKIIILKKSEEDFKRELLDQYRHGKGEKGPKGPK